MTMMGGRDRQRRGIASKMIGGEYMKVLYISRAKITNRRIDIKNRRRIYQGPESSVLIDVQKSKIKDSHI